MGTSKKYKPINLCKNCGINVVNMSRDKQDKHEKECKRQTKLM